MKYSTSYEIPAYLVQRFGDSGTYQTEHDKDDLRIHIELSGGVKLLLDGQCRLIMKQEGIQIQFLA